jgi:hypothetical protein
MSDKKPQRIPPPLKTDLVTTEFDERHGILIVHYHKELTAESTRQMYGWMLETAREYGIDFVNGVIYNFSDVKRFTRSNLVATQKNSLTINAQIDLSQMPVAMVAKTLIQEQHLSISLKATPGESRKRIVNSIQQGITFIEQWNRDNKRDADSGSKEEAAAAAQSD